MPLGPLSKRAAAPAVLSMPDGGLAWRPLTLADAAALHRLVVAIETADAEPYRMSLPEVTELLADAEARDLTTDSLVGIDPEGTARAFAVLDAPAGDHMLRRVIHQGGVEPGWRGRGIGTDLIAWATGRARQILATGDEAVPGRIGVFREDDAPAASHALLAEAGYRPIRYYSDLRRDLAEPIPDIALPAGLRLLPWSPDVDEPARLAHNDAFRDHWGSQPRTAQAWTHGRSTFAPEWTFVVVAEPPSASVAPAEPPAAPAELPAAPLLDRTSSRPGPDLDLETTASLAAGAPLVVGYHWAGHYEEDFAVRGYSFGYTNLLGVRRGWRGRRIAPALLAAGMRAFARAGMEYAALDVDTANPTGAHGLYERLGYVKTSGSRMYTIEV